MKKKSWVRVLNKWKLKVNNIAGFKGKVNFPLSQGLNIILGENATGKTSLINSIKILNKLSQPSKDDKPNADLIKKYLHDKTLDANILLQNTDYEFYNNIVNPVKKITDFIGSSKKTNKKTSKSKKNKWKPLSEDPKVIPFSFIDTENRIMEEIEYSGSINLLKEEIMEISQVKYYQDILNHSTRLQDEYKKKKNEILKKLHSQHKEIELSITQNKKELLELEKNTVNLNYEEEDSDESKILKEKQKVLTQKYNKLHFEKNSKATKELNRRKVIVEKNQAELYQRKSKEKELADFKNKKDAIIKNENQLAEFSRKKTALELKKREIYEQKSMVITNINLLQETLNANEESAICVHCLGEINTKHVTKKLEELMDEKEELLKKYNKIDDDIQDITIKETNLRQMVQNQKKIPQQIGKLTKEINVLTKRIDDDLGKISTIKSEIANYQVEIDDYKEKIAKIDDKLIDLSNYDEELKREYYLHLSKIKLLKDKIESLFEQDNLISRRILMVPEGYNLILHRIEQLIEILNNKLDDFYYNFLDYVNEELAKLLEQLNWKVKEVSVNDMLEIRVTNYENKNQDFQTLSTFERKSIGILIILIFRLKYFPDYPVFAIDEHLNSADPERFLKFILFIENLLKDKQGLFIVTVLPFEERINFFKDYQETQIDGLKIYN
jgi:predicted  nucleic acid-binding Zn-ribbon protein